MNKAIIFKALAVTLIILSYSCSKEDSISEKSKGFLKYTFTIGSDQKSTINMKCDDEPDAIYISIKDSEHTYIYNLHKFPLIKIGEEFITEEIKLTINNYCETQLVNIIS